MYIAHSGGYDSNLIMSMLCQEGSNRADGIGYFIHPIYLKSLDGGSTSTHRPNVDIELLYIERSLDYFRVKYDTVLIEPLQQAYVLMSTVGSPMNRRWDDTRYKNYMDNYNPFLSRFLINLAYACDEGDVHELYMGFKKGDCSIPQLADFEQAMNSIRQLSFNDRIGTDVVDLKFRYPLLHHTKGEIIDKLKNHGILNADICFSCEGVGLKIDEQSENGGFVPCGKCAKCLEVKPFLNANK